jgi:hypothetical protein
MLRRRPGRRSVANAVEHMWGYVSKHATADERQSALGSASAMLTMTRTLAARFGSPYLRESTALGELAMFVYGDHA